MARLPDPVTEKMHVEWPERDEWATMTKGFFSILGQTVRNARAAERESEEVEEE